MQTKIKRWGNSAAVRIPTRLLDAAGLDVHSPVSMRVQAGKVIIEPVSAPRRRLRLPFTEAQLLDGLTPETAHADALASLRGIEAAE